MVKSIIKKVNKNSKSSKQEESKKVVKPKIEINVHKVVEKSKHTPVQKKSTHKEQKHVEVKPSINSKLKSKKHIEPKIDMPIESKIEKPIVEIHSLKELEEKILEKLEEHKPEIKEKIISEEIIPITTTPVDSIVEKYNKKNHTKSTASDNTEAKDYKTRVEAVLFAVGKYLEEEVISQLCDIDKRHTKKALEELKFDYDARDTALMVVQEGNSWKINVREKYLGLVRKIVADTELSKSIMETLAVIAWKTPIYQNEVVRIRGNKCYDHIAELENAGFVTKDKKGRSYVLKTTDKFYNYFDIDSKNLHGVMSEAKMPITQTTLDESKPEDTPYSREKLLQALETIETKSIVQTEEDKLAQKQFLEQIHHKIDEAAKELTKLFQNYLFKRLNRLNL